ncbi:MAG: NUDIX hydrolase [Candidatus Magasanikbacteria bacterium CG_4_10_14_0_2_um_filter_41_10]|uniref:NUDIX hydrolase n=1 Tax=Candidatus Magasanikbacteria bacterium CG_4_10_14_0_2_um_filter_41_10 TaxID=1974638 RepID=A0A2M7V6R3_9BACT|nr:MAG: NUDIX hydrolase [Candidatus Magasanikbacteria bacterium CG_4_10_14_0_2_um_filter_41_10]
MSVNSKCNDMKKERFRIFSAVYLIFEKEGSILLLQRKNTRYMPGYYTPIAGHSDGNESATSAVIREAKEEAGVIVSKKDVSVAYITHRYSIEREYIDIYFVATHWEGEPRNMEPEKSGDMQWFDKKNLPNNVIPEVVVALHAIEKNIHYGEYGWDHEGSSLE